MRLQIFSLNVGSPKLALSFYYITKHLGSHILGIHLFADVNTEVMTNRKVSGRVFIFPPQPPIEHNLHIFPLLQQSAHALRFCSSPLATLDNPKAPHQGLLLETSSELRNNS